MINHPVIQSARSIIIYLAAWILISVVHVAILYYYYLTDISLAVFDSLIFNFSFALLGIPIWFTVRYSNLTSSNIISILVNQLTSLIIIIFLWFGSVYLLYIIFMAGHPEYTSFLYKTAPWRIIIGLFYYFIIALVYYLIIYYHNLNEKMLNEAKLMGLLKESELNLLKSQINPHFLFNSLNSISSLTMSDAAKAQEMIIKLSDFLRYTISMESEVFTSLDKEIDNIKRYLEIEKIRFGEKLNFLFDLEDACIDKKIPLMILQPLYENAIKHGVYESIEPIMIKTICRKIQGFLEISIENNFEDTTPIRKGAGLGLKNTRERLKLIYQNDQLLKIDKKENVFKVIISFPE